MAVGPLSRYGREAVFDVVLPDGTLRTTVAARWADGTPADIVWHIVVEGDSFESLAARHLGSSALWWRIADANPLVFPLDLPPGVAVAIPAGRSESVNPRRRSWGDG